MDIISLWRVFDGVRNEIRSDLTQQSGVSLDITVKMAGINKAMRCFICSLKLINNCLKKLFWIDLLWVVLEVASFHLGNHQHIIQHLDKLTNRGFHSLEMKLLTIRVHAIPVITKQAI